jgi:hypothetical protein
MAITTYDELKTAIQNYLDRDDLDEDELIDLAEARHQRDIRIREMITRDSITVDSRQISLPSGFLEMLQIRLLTDPVTVLEEVNIHEMTRIRVETTGKPKWFVEQNEIEFDKSPDDSYSGEILFYKAFTALSDADTSNALLTRAPDAYLYASLLAAEPFIFNDERLPLWEKLYTSARDRLNAVDRKRAGPLVSRVVGDTP